MIRQDFNADDLEKQMTIEAERVTNAFVEAYKANCFEAVRRAKMVDTYKDQTGYLRSSIGYVLYKDGVEIANYFTMEPPGGDGKHSANGTQGAQDAYAFAKRVADDAGHDGIVAVIVAGAGYARYVENKGFDVLTGSTLQFDDDLKKKFLEIEKML